MYRINCRYIRFYAWIVIEICFVFSSFVSEHPLHSATVEFWFLLFGCDLFWLFCHFNFKFFVIDLFQFVFVFPSFSISLGFGFSVSRRHKHHNGDFPVACIHQSTTFTAQQFTSELPFFDFAKVCAVKWSMISISNQQRCRLYNEFEWAPAMIENSSFIHHSMKYDIGWDSDNQQLVIIDKMSTK